MCDCKTTIEKRLLERFKELHPDATEHDVRLSGYAFILGAEVTMKPSMPIEATAFFPLKKGGRKLRRMKQSMIFTFCPFCGVSLETEKGAANG